MRSRPSAASGPQAPSTPISRHQLATDLPVLLLSGDADPITPPRYADDGGCRCLEREAPRRRTPGSRTDHRWLHAAPGRRVRRYGRSRRARRRVPGTKLCHAVLHRFLRTDAMIQVDGIHKSFGKVHARCAASASKRRDGNITGLARPERRRQVDDAARALHGAEARRGHGQHRRHRRGRRAASRRASVSARCRMAPASIRT